MLHPPVLELEGQTIRFREENLEVTEQPEFFVLTTQLPEKGLRLWLRTFAIKDKDNRLYWDGFFLAPGDLSDMPGIPQYLDINGDTILWGGTTHTNLIRNGSAERIWPLLSSKLSKYWAVRSMYRPPTFGLFSIWMQTVGIIAQH